MPTAPSFPGSWPTILYPRVMRDVNEKLSYDAVIAQQVTFTAQLGDLNASIAAQAVSLAGMADSINEFSVTVASLSVATETAHTLAAGSIITANNALTTANSAVATANANNSAITTINSTLLVKADLVSGKVPASQLPSYVDDILEYANTAAFPVTGESGKIYLDLSTSPASQYRWTGTIYQMWEPSPGSTDAVPEGSNNLYFTNTRADARADARIAAAIGSSVQAINANLTSLSGLVGTPNNLPYFSGPDNGAMSLTSLTAFGRTVIGLADAAALRTTMSLPTTTVVGRMARYIGTAGQQGQTASLFEDGSGNVGVGATDPTSLLDLNGSLTVRGLGSAPSLAPAGQGRVYFDTTLQKFRLSENGGAYDDLGFPGAYRTKIDLLTVTASTDLDAIRDRVNALDAAVVLKGGWDASTGTFPGGGTAQAGWSYIVTVAGTVDGVAFAVNDRALAYTDNASTTTYAGNWLKLDYTDQVLSVAGRTGSVTLTSSDLTDVTAFARTLLDDADAATMRTTLGAQEQNAGLSAIAVLTSAADRLPYFTGSGTAALATFTTFGRSLVDDADAAAARSTLALGTMATETASNYLTTAAAASTYLTTAAAAAGYQPLDSDLQAIAALSTTSFGRSLLALADAAAARTALALGTMATETASNYLTTAAAASGYQPLDGDLSSIASLTTAAFGRSLLTQADATAARSTLGLVIGTNVQAYDAKLSAIAGLTGVADALPYFTGASTAAATTLTSFGRTLIDDPDASTARTTLGLTIGTNVQAYHANLASLSGLTDPGVDKLLFWNDTTNAFEHLGIGTNLSITGGVLNASGGGGGSSLSDGDYGDIVVSSGATVLSIDSSVISTFGRTLTDDADAATARSTLGLVIGTNVQAYSSILQNTTASFLTAQETKLGHITVTQAVDLDAIEARVNELDAAVVLKGAWDASAGTFPGAGAAQAGWSYIVSVGGTVDGVAFTANDRIVAVADNASTTTYASNWLKLDYTDQVLSVAGRTGSVTLTSSDLTDVTAFARTLLDDSDATAARSTLGLVIGTNVQAYSSILQNTTASFLTAQETKLGFITVTGAANLDTLTAHAASTSNPHSVTKAQVGLGNVDNTSDSSKPISTATSTALSGKAATDGSNLTGRLAPIGASAPTNLNSTVQSGFYRLDTGLTNAPSGVDWGHMIVGRGSDTMVQIASDYQSTKLAWRSAYDLYTTPVFGAWRTILHDANYSSYAAGLTTTNTLSGTNTFSGAVNLNGTAAATNTSAIAMASINWTYGLEARATGAGAAFMTFHRPGAYGLGLGLDTDNVMKIGGWSFGTPQPIIHAGNISSYSSSAVKAFINFNGTGTPSIRSSSNVSSITDHGTGTYTINFTSALADANYAVVGTATTDGGVGNPPKPALVVEAMQYGPSYFSKTTTACRIEVRDYTNAVVDLFSVNIVFLR
jgi:hypothetical protein